VPIAAKSDQIPETSAATVVIFAQMSEIGMVTFANCVTTGARARHKRSSEQIGRKSESIRATCAPIARTFVETFVIDEATVVITGKIDGRRAGTDEQRAVTRGLGSGSSSTRTIGAVARL
jgi:hypothetical protein